jgi:hypothetical protein
MVKSDIELAFSKSAIQYAPKVESEDEDEDLIGEDIQKEIKIEL